MLVLSRKLHESIVLPDLGITIRVIGVNGGRVRLGVEAPREVSIARGEICDGVAPRRAEERPQSRIGEHGSLTRSGEHAAVRL